MLIERGKKTTLPFSLERKDQNLSVIGQGL